MAEFNQNTYRKWFLPALGVAETIATKGKSPGRVAMGQEQIFRDIEESERAAAREAMERQLTESQLEDARIRRKTSEEQAAQRKVMEQELADTRKSIGAGLSVGASPDDPEMQEFMFKADPDAWIKSKLAPKPRDRFVVKEVNGRQVQVNLDTNEQIDLGPITPKPDQRPRYKIETINGRRVQINLDTHEQIDLGPADNTQSQKNNEKVTNLNVFRKQLENVKAARRGLGQADFGLLAGRQSLTERGRLFDKAVAALTPTVTALTRVPGEGSASDFEQRLKLAPLPSRVATEREIDQSIQQLEDLVSSLDSSYRTYINAGGVSPNPVVGVPNRPAAGGKSRFKIEIE